MQSLAYLAIALGIVIIYLIAYLHGYKNGSADEIEIQNKLWEERKNNIP